MLDTLDYTVTDGVALIVLNRPQHHNAVNNTMQRELAAVWSRFKADSTALVAILTGAGGKAFCTGADIADLPALDEKPERATLASIRWTSLQNQVWKPVICAVNGMTVGGGLHFIADSDIVIAADSATFFDTHVKVGLVAGLEPVSLCRRMPMEAVLRMALVGGGERVNAQRAFELGAVGEVVPLEQLLPRAYEIAAMIRQHSPAALQRTKQAIWQAAEMSLQDGLQNAWRLMMEQATHADFTEGGAAFLQRRAPAWQPPREA